MNFSELQERLRMELLRRIDRGSLNGSLLARQTGFRPSHISNFLRRRRTLSLQALDRMLAAQMLTIADLLPTTERRPTHATVSSLTHMEVPVVTPTSAIYDAAPPPSAIVDLLQLPVILLNSMRPRRASSRRGWSRFVAVRVTRLQAAGMQPLLTENAIAVIDRHYNSPAPYLPPQPSLFAVRVDNALHLRLIEFTAGRLLLRPLEIATALHILAPTPHQMPSDLLVGRICLTIAPTS